MTSRTTEFRVGIAVILAAIILILGFLWIGEFRLNRKWAAYHVYFDEVGGLSPGDPVAISGLEMGKVGSISLQDGRVRTELLIEEEVVLKEDCSVEVRSIGLMGERYIHILPGSSGERLVPGSVIEGKYTAGLPEVAAGMGEIIDEMRQAAESLKRAVATTEDDPTLGESLAKLNLLTTEILAFLRENRDDIRSTTRSMRQISDDVGEVVGSKTEDLAVGIDRFSQAAARLDSLTITLQAIVSSVEQGEGSLGMLIKDSKLHEEIEANLESLNQLITDIKEHPERYLKIEIF
jgi:phospholipid/cholesterol/gamma-HCH transport system substrate-binding protein